MPAAPPDEFFPERPRLARDLFWFGLVAIVMILVLSLLLWGREGALASVLGVAFVAMVFLGGFGVFWLLRRRGLRAWVGGLVEVFRLRQQRVHPWEDIVRLEEKTTGDGLQFIVKTKTGSVQFDDSVRGWERLTARIRAELQERAPESDSAPVITHAPEVAQLAAWLGIAETDLPQTLRYSFGAVCRVLYRWLVGLGVLVSLVVLAYRRGIGHPGGGNPLWYSTMTFLIPFIGVSYRLILTWQRARNAYITVMEEGLTFVDHHGVARHYCWEEVLAVSEIRREWSGFFPSAQAIRAAVSPAALQVRTPWGYFEIDASLEKYEALRNLIEQVIAAREAPPAYPATLLAPSDAALSRARPGGTEVPTERALSRAVAPEEEKPRLTGEVEEEAKVEQK